MILLLLVISIIFISPEKIQGTLITFSLWKRNYVGFMFWLLHPDQTSTTNQTTKPNHHITKLNFSDLITHCVCHLERRSPKPIESQQKAFSSVADFEIQKCHRLGSPSSPESRKTLSVLAVKDHNLLTPTYD